MRNTENEIYVLIAERDTYQPEPDSRAIVFEQYLDQGAATLEAMKARQKQMGQTYGKTRIAKLQFIEE